MTNVGYPHLNDKSQHAQFHIIGEGIILDNNSTAKPSKTKWKTIETTWFMMFVL